MPLPPLDPTNTKRYFLGNTAGLLNHHITIRATDAVDDAAMVTILQARYSALLPVMFSDCGFPELLVAQRGSNVRNPVAGWTPLVGQVAGGQPDNDEPLTLCARGRGPDGRKVKHFLWGFQFARAENWKFDPGAGTVYRTYLDQLNTSLNIYITVSASQPVWKPDFTVQYNDHAVKQKRG